MENITLYETALYTYMKRLYGNEFKLKPNERLELETMIINQLDLKLNYENISQNLINSLQIIIKNSSKKILLLEEYERLLSMWDNDIYPYLFLTALKLIDYKVPLCALINQSVKQTICDERPLTLKYDNITVTSVYMKRAITLRHMQTYIYNKIESDNIFKFIMQKLETNSICIIGSYYPIIIESLKQASVSKGGATYEDLIYNYLLEIGLDKYSNNIQRFGHEDIGSLENDFKFTYNGRKFGISAKKTLRERYKQYVNLTEKETDLDIFLTITLGTDLTKDKAETIRSFGVYIFVSPEVYNSRKFLQKIDGIFNIFDLNFNLLNSLK
ncbi:UNVERIFIED_ORG: hypothetical protein B2H95_00805 [Clostridium botulinum]|nr:hypothetical protein [Clostridium botulinum]